MMVQCVKCKLSWEPNEPISELPPCPVCDREAEIARLKKVLGPAAEQSNSEPRATYVGAPQFFNLNQACILLADAFGPHIYLVGSSLQKRDWRDVDVRCILDDQEYDRLFPGPYVTQERNSLWSLMCTSISLWLSQQSGLPVDFQIQRRTQANESYRGRRHALGIFLAPQPQEQEPKP